MKALYVVVALVVVCACPKQEGKEASPTKIEAPAAAVVVPAVAPAVAPAPVVVPAVAPVVAPVAAAVVPEPKKDVAKLIPSRPSDHVVASGRVVPSVARWHDFCFWRSLMSMSNEELASFRKLAGLTELDPTYKQVEQLLDVLDGRTTGASTRKLRRTRLRGRARPPSTFTAS
jgi:hypothetical protein